MHTHIEVKQFTGRNSKALVKECGCGSRSYYVPDYGWSMWRASLSAFTNRKRQNARNLGLI